MSLYVRTALSILILLPTASASAVVVLNESFDSDAGFSKSTTFFTDGSKDYFGITGVNDFDGDPVASGVPSFSGFDSNFLIGEDLDSGGGPSTVTLTWAGLDIAGLTDIVISSSFAAELQEWDVADDGIDLEYQIDGGGYVTAFRFRTDGTGTSGGTFNGDLALDSDGMGFGEGAVLTRAAQDFDLPISETGTTLDLQLTISANSGDEAFAVDNIGVVGTLAAIPEPTAAIFGSLVATGLGVCISRRPKGRD